MPEYLRVSQAERELKERFGLEAVIHLDPVEMGDPGADRLRALAEGLAREIDPAATIHDFRRGGEGEVSFDVVVPYDVALSDRQVREALAEKLEDGKLKEMFRRCFVSTAAVVHKFLWKFCSVRRIMAGE